MFRDQRDEGETRFFWQNKHNTRDGYQRGAKVTNDSRRKRRNELGRARKKDVSEKRGWWPF